MKPTAEHKLPANAVILTAEELNEIPLPLAGSGQKEEPSATPGRHQDPKEALDTPVYIDNV